MRKSFYNDVKDNVVKIVAVKFWGCTCSYVSCCKKRILVYKIITSVMSAYCVCMCTVHRLSYCTLCHACTGS